MSDLGGNAYDVPALRLVLNGFKVAWEVGSIGGHIGKTLNISQPPSVFHPVLALQPQRELDHRQRPALGPQALERPEDFLMTKLVEVVQDKIVQHFRCAGQDAPQRPSLN